MDSSSSSSSIGYYSVIALFLLFSLKGCCAQLSTNYYSTSCPNVFLAIKPVVEAAIARERRMGASLLRLSFHDCFVNGCDGSLLLDDTPTFTGEKNSNANRNSARGFDVIDDVKAAVERVCPGVVSCADIITIVARDSVAILGGPYWDVKLGRRDARTASQSEANNNIPNPTSSLSTLMSKFSAQGLSTKELVALSGAHTIGNARCTNFRARIYNETNIDRAFAGMRRQSCPLNSGSGDNNLAPLDLQTPTGFDNLYYKNLVGSKGLLHSDQQLYTSDSTGFLVRSYADNSNSFNSDFVAAMIKMNDIRPLTRNDGEIRRNCRRVNN